MIAGLILTGCAEKPTQKAVTPPERPMITQAQVVALMKNYDTISYKANMKSDAKLMATIADGGLLARSLGTYHMAGLVGDRLPYKPDKSPKPIAFIPRAGAYPSAFFVYSKTSGKAKANRLDVFRRSGAAAPWKKVISAASEKPLPPIAVGPSGLATAVAPDASGYAVKPIDVAPLLAKALLSANSPEGAKFRFQSRGSWSSFHMTNPGRISLCPDGCMSLEEAGASPAEGTSTAGRQRRQGG